MWWFRISSNPGSELFTLISRLCGLEPILLMNTRPCLFQFFLCSMQFCVCVVHLQFCQNTSCQMSSPNHRMDTRCSTFASGCQLLKYLFFSGFPIVLVTSCALSPPLAFVSVHWRKDDMRNLIRPRQFVVPLTNISCQQENLSTIDQTSSAFQNTLMLEALPECLSFVFRPGWFSKQRPKKVALPLSLSVIEDTTTRPPPPASCRIVVLHWSCDAARPWRWLSPCYASVWAACRFPQLSITSSKMTVQHTLQLGFFQRLSWKQDPRNSIFPKLHMLCQFFLLFVWCLSTF